MHSESKCIICLGINTDSYSKHMDSFCCFCSSTSVRKIVPEIWFYRFLLNYNLLPKRFGSVLPLFRFGSVRFGGLFRPNHRTETSFGRSLIGRPACACDGRQPYCGDGNSLNVHWPLQRHIVRLPGILWGPDLHHGGLPGSTDALEDPSQMSMRRQAAILWGRQLSQRALAASETYCEASRHIVGPGSASRRPARVNRRIGRPASDAHATAGCHIVGTTTLSTCIGRFRDIL